MNIVLMYNILIKVLAILSIKRREKDKENKCALSVYKCLYMNYAVTKH